MPPKGGIIVFNCLLVRLSQFTLTFCVNVLYSETTAPMTFKLHKLMVLIGATTHTDFGVTRSRSLGPTLTFYMKAFTRELLHPWPWNFTGWWSPHGGICPVLFKLCLLFGLRKFTLKFCMQVDISSLTTDIASELYTNIWDDYGSSCN